MGRLLQTYPWGSCWSVCAAGATGLRPRQVQRACAGERRWTCPLLAAVFVRTHSCASTSLDTNTHAYTHTRAEPAGRGAQRLLPHSSPSPKQIILQRTPGPAPSLQYADVSLGVRGGNPGEDQHRYVAGAGGGAGMELDKQKLVRRMGEVVVSRSFKDVVKGDVSGRGGGVATKLPLRESPEGRTKAGMLCAGDARTCHAHFGVCV